MVPGSILRVGDKRICAPGGQVTSVPGSPRVMVSGMPVAPMADTYPVAGCVFTVGPKPQPCVKVLWLVPAARVQVMGQPVIIQTSVGLCPSAELIPQGPPSVILAQTRAIAT